ncbi:bifunctional riboflavin kinase/FAD synthetase [Lapillicoccus sp.]|uniref:bifunctional riboflavin kinase/FAD synthetase n=1 Tax=Lapillicoccus sp. TaxID=1909287 RepID=UPI0025D6AA8D|nr:bifunctional riboflavin kinase/FAD synthetase [Lapillicoccus sp.]
MHVWNSLDDVPGDLGRSVVTLGNFDGVHQGHKAVLARVVEQATSRGVLSVAVTFEPHPLAVLHPDRAPQMLTSVAQRLELLADTGLDAVLVLEFTVEFAQETPEEFVQSVFVDALHAVAVVVGQDTRFGWRNTGNVDTLLALGPGLGFEVLALDDLGEGSRWSSSMVRGMLDIGDVAGAAAVLGRPHKVAGTVVHGDHRGRELGYPTANLSQDAEGLVPADGVYAGWLTRVDRPITALDRVLPAAISIGTNPTFEGTQRRVEGYVLDRTDLDLYGERITYEFVERLRPTLRFDGIEPLIEQMETDVGQCREILRSIVPS